MSLSAIANMLPLGPAPRIKSKLIEILLPAIELAVASGYSHSQVHALLTERGILMEFRYYEQVIYRLRKKRAAARSQYGGDVRALETGPNMVEENSVTPQCLQSPKPVLNQDPRDAATVIGPVHEKEADLSTAFTTKAEGAASTIESGAGSQSLRKYKGRALLERDINSF